MATGKVLLLLVTCALCFTAAIKESKSFAYEKGIVANLSHCPGRYCGRTKLRNESWSACGACERGFRSNPLSECKKCNDEPKLYDWLYLGFMGLLPLTFHLGCIDAAAKRRTFTKEVMALYASAVVEVAVAAVATLLITDPVGSFNIRSCTEHGLADWYPLFHNPNPNYEGVLHCTQEAVYPLYSMVFVFYTLCLMVMLLIRPLLSSKLLPGRGKSAIYSALYFLPILIFTHAVGAGLIYYSFPYLVIILSVVSNAAHFAFQLDQSMPGLLLGCIRDIRNLVILIGHWGLHAYGIIAIMVLNEKDLYGSLCALVPLPAVFYILTSRFTDPSNMS
ncbi:JNK1/MAPK8-associated membrane protein-like [Penaeus chinensis]|uniref:JNK1/MAPK8-associated membrane protein-like n=1 Tax=Penaeus chinensis TaxID=139456 RepID=UPI001FB754EF|nr:JNK1/MAPK8-associated membrane protein-like [Penaeus chinensis]XP_047480875.1 JNK1/MAPK8-associated membrane protein-like [Penaeus chinensis]XP_047480876.1 JNK1/MAPK8-associated membrane protein-like [Penaeus chinensis]